MTYEEQYPKHYWFWFADKPAVILARVTGRIYGDYLVGDLSFEDMMAACSSIRQLEDTMYREGN